MSTKVEEVRLDVEELKSLLEKAIRQHTKDVLSLELRKLQTELSKLTEGESLTPAKLRNSVPSTTQKCYEVKLNNYGWDETNDAVKLYVTLKDVHSLPKEAIVCNFTENSIDLRVFGLQNKNYHLPINNLCEEIDIDKSHFKVKTDMIVVTLKKKILKHWSHVTGVEKKIKEAKSMSVPGVSDDSDPGASLINLMKKMYQEGDDDMKKTIAKAWTESQQGNVSGMPNYPSL